MSGLNVTLALVFAFVAGLVPGAFLVTRFYAWRLARSASFREGVLRAVISGAVPPSLAMSIRVYEPCPLCHAPAFLPSEPAHE